MQDKQFWIDRLTKTKELIATYEDAATAISTGQAQSYTIDTGQTRQTVTKANISEIDRILSSLYNRVATLEARIYGCGTATGIPCF